MLKNLLKEIGKCCNSLNLSDKVKFDLGDKFDILRLVVPYGKFAALYNATSYGTFGKAFSERAKILGFKPLNFIMPDFAALNFKNVFDVIGVPSDVRAIVFFDAELSDIALYLATVFGVPCVYIMRRLDLGNFLRARVLFFSAPFGDTFTLSCIRRVVIDTAFTETRLSEKEISEKSVGFAGKALSVADFAAYRAVSDNMSGENVAAFDCAKNAVLSALSLNSGISEDTALKLFCDECLFDLSDLALNGAIVCNSAEYSFFRLAGKKTAALGYEFIYRAVKLYAVACEEKDPVIVPEYIGRCEVLKKITGKDDGWFLRGFVKQSELLAAGGEEKAVNAVKDLLSSFGDIAKTLRNAERFYESGDFDFSPFTDALKYCGDLPDTFNFMTAVRARGLLG